MSSHKELYVTEWSSLDIEEEDTSDISEDGSDESRYQYRCNNKFLVRAFCREENGKSVVLEINNFHPYFYIKIPDQWKSYEADVFISDIKKNKIKKWYTDTLVKYQIVNAKPFYGFTGYDKFKYMKLSFSCLAGFYYFRKLFQQELSIRQLLSKPFYFEPFESNLLPLLRFIHCHKIKSVGWIKVNNYIQIYNDSTCDSKLSCQPKDIEYLEKNSLPSGIKTVAYDIECGSSHGDFPISKKDCRKLARDIIMEYNRIKQQYHYNYSEMKIVIANFLKYSFNSGYNNYNIRNLTFQNKSYFKDITTKKLISDNWLPSQLLELIEKWSPEILKILESNDEYSNYQLLDIFETQFPEIDYDKSDYLDLANQIVREYKSEISKNSRPLSENPLLVIKNMLELSFNPYYHNLNINRVYSKPPRLSIILNIIPSINEICNKSYQIYIKKIISTRNGIKHKSTVKVNDYVPRLTRLLNKYLPKPEDDEVIQIGSTFKLYGDKDCYLKHIICLKGCEPISNEDLIKHEYDGVMTPKDEIIKYITKKTGVKPNKNEKQEYWDSWNEIIINEKIKNSQDKSQVVVECYDTEEEVLLAWQKLISNQDPDFVIGFNTFGFDYKYLYDRAEQLGIKDEFMKLGKIKNVEQKLVEKELKSNGLGENYLYYIEMEGRVGIDLYKVMQGMHKLNSYKLDSICKIFLNKKKVDVSPQDIFIKQRGSNKDRRVLAEYCLIDCVLCNRLLDRFEIILNNVGMAQVCSVPLSYLFLRGQGIKLFSYVAKKCREKGFLIPVIESIKENEKFEGATVLDPDTGIHNKDPVAVADFNSLYPSCIIGENLSHDSFIGSMFIKKGESTNKKGICITDSIYERCILEGKFEGWGYNDITYPVYKHIPTGRGKKTKKVLIGYKLCRFAEPPDGEKGVVPSILIELLASRKEAKKIRDQYEPGTFMYNLYDSLQLAYKTVANSLYGIIGASSSKIRLKEIAACTTATGRKLIEFSCNFVLKNYAGSKITYGDTDSIFCKFECKNKKGLQLKGLDAINKSILLSTESAFLISEQLKAPHNLEFEKAIYPFILLSKKKYHGHYYESYGSPKYKPKSMGIVLKRRDNAPIVKTIFGGMVDIIMDNKDISQAIEFVKKECRNVLDGKYDINNFIISKTLKGYYKLPDTIAHNVLAQRMGERDPGSKPRANDRIAYVFVEKPDAILQGDRIETPDFIKEHNLKIDYSHYITNQISKPVLQILELANKGLNLFDELLEQYKYVGYKKITEFRSLFNVVKKNSYVAGHIDESDESDEEDESDEDDESDGEDEFYDLAN
jgi:DNA polymerase elongation subunit (family B)